MCSDKLKQLLFLLYKGLNKHSSGRYLKKEFNHYLDVILMVLNTGMAWRQITLNELHYTTYYKFFIKLIRLDLFNLAYKIVLLCHHKHNSNQLDTLFIDSTLIKNINGSQLLGKNPCDRGRNGNKITVIVDKFGIPVSIHLASANIHDSQLINTSINKSSIKLINCKIVGDRGYINEKIKMDLSKNDNINLIYPYRNNQKKGNSRENIQLLKKRHIVENFFSWLKRRKRIQQRYEKKYINYLNFVYLAVIDIVAKKVL